MSNSQNTQLTVGQTVTVWPRITPANGESRDTEPGAQPWKATVVGWTDTKVIVACEYSPDGIRALDRELVR
jgi:hypothetical protein